MTDFRRNFSLLFALVIAAFCARAAHAAQAFVVIDAKSGHVLQERNSKDKRQVGSLTKIATAAVVLDWAEKHNGDLSQKATVPPDAFMGGENLVGFQPGDVVELRDLLYAALIQSDNIAAHTLADHVGRAITGIVPPGRSGTPVATFVGQMNALAETLGMTRTLFVNPHGSDANVKPVPYSTAADMARLTRYSMNKAGFRFYVSQKERQISWDRGGKTQSYVLRNTNELLGQDGVEGVKTGRTARAGDCLILSAQRQAQVVKHSESNATVFPRHLILVLLASPNRFGEGQQLLNLGWQLHEQWAAAGRQVDPKKVL
ncbi:MAG: serine hydrolase [Verrucomicrobiaceae bacterium]|nr:serine hydrolase [Verrucomicrobiaceae bacterium]